MAFLTTSGLGALQNPGFNRRAVRSPPIGLSPFFSKPGSPLYASQKAPTQFLWYELETLGLVSKKPRNLDGTLSKRKRDQDATEALTHLREVGLVPWSRIVDETRHLYSFATAPSVPDYVAAAEEASLDRWAGKPAPHILYESRSLAGVLYDLAAAYACPIAVTNGTARDS